MRKNHNISKKNATIAACMFFVLTAFIAGGISNLQKYDEQKAQPVLTERVADKKYILKLHEGKIAIYTENKENPDRLTDISEHTLCAYDHSQLSAGVVVIGDVELAMRLEDYGS